MLICLALCRAFVPRPKLSVEFSCVIGRSSVFRYRGVDAHSCLTAWVLLDLLLLLQDVYAAEVLPRTIDALLGEKVKPGRFGTCQCCSDQ